MLSRRSLPWKLPNSLRNLLGVRQLSSRPTEETKPELPDYNTDVNIHKHKLKRPEKPPGSARWKGLEGLQERTKVGGFSLFDLLSTVPIILYDK